MLEGLIKDARRNLFFTGKGGVGKTSTACAAAFALADLGRRVLLVSTDPASNLDEVLQTQLGDTPRPVRGASGIDAMNIDPLQAARAYRDRVVEPYRGVLPESAIASIEEQLSGGCTVEVAAFDVFVGLVVDSGASAGYDHVVFDTAPTGHTLRLLELPSAWSGYIDESTQGVSCIGPLSGLETQQEAYRQATAVLSDPGQTLLVLVTRPDSIAISEAARAASELQLLGIDNQRLVVNGVFSTQGSDDELAMALAERSRLAMEEALEPILGHLERDEVPLLAFNPMGAAAFREILAGRAGSVAEFPGASPPPPVVPISQLVDELAARGRGQLTAPA